MRRPKGIDVRTERIQLRVTPSQKSLIEKEAKLCGLSVCDYILLCVQIHYNTYQEPNEFIDLIQENQSLFDTPGIQRASPTGRERS